LIKQQCLKGEVDYFPKGMIDDHIGVIAFNGVGQMECRKSKSGYDYNHVIFPMTKNPNITVEVFVVWAGIEPATQGFSVLCSTD
jgi:hypothetical protein